MKSRIKPSKITKLDVDSLVKKKRAYFQDVIQRVVLYSQQNKRIGIINIGDYNSCIKMVSSFGRSMSSPDLDGENAINVLQLVNNELSTIFKSFGCNTLDDLLFICFGSSDTAIYATGAHDIHKFELLKKYFHPTGYKICNKNGPSLVCEDISATAKPFYVQVHGMQLTISHPANKRGLIITGVVDDILLEVLNSEYINDIRTQTYANKPNEDAFSNSMFDSFVNSLTLKEYFIFTPDYIYTKYMGYVSQLNTINQKTVNTVIKEFIAQPLFLKRNTMILLLINTAKNDNQYLAYLLYDLMSDDTIGSIDTQDQMTLFDSFPNEIKQCFRMAMKKTIQYTTDLSDFDTNKIPIEQQICLMHAPDSVKEKAMQKLKEVKSKSEDSCSKAKQYLDGLLKIPFGVIRKEPILQMVGEIKQDFLPLRTSDKDYTNIEIIQQLTSKQSINAYKTMFLATTKLSHSTMESTIISFHSDIKLTNTNKTKTIAQMTANIDQFIDHCFKYSHFQMLAEFILKTKCDSSKPLLDSVRILEKYNNISTNIKSISSVHAAF